MKQSKVKKIVAAVCAICAMWTFSYFFTSHAESTSDKVKKVQEELEKSRQNVGQSRKEVEQIESSKAQLEGKLADLNNQLAVVGNELEIAQNQLSEKQQEIDNIKIQLAQAQELEQEQYESMKKRIQYMYENNNTDILQIFLSSGDFSDMLNSADFFLKMTEYDHGMQEELTKTRQVVENATLALEEEERQLQLDVEQVETKRQEVEHLVNQTAEEIARQGENLAAAEQRAAAYEQELREQQNTLQALKAREAEEQRILSQGSQGATTNSTVNYDSSGKVTGNGSSSTSSSGAKGYEAASAASDLKLLANIIYCEAGNQPYEGQIAVGSVVMNRINSPKFPNTMLGVLYQKSQFTPVMSGRFAIALANDSATSSCYSAAQEVLNGVNNVPDCLFFRTVIPSIHGTIIGAHVFY